MYLSDEGMIQEASRLLVSSLSDADKAEQIVALAEKAAPERRALWEEALAAKALYLKGDHASACAAFMDILQPHAKEELGDLFHAYLLRHAGFAFGKNGDVDAEIAVYDDVIAAYKDRDEPALQEQVVIAMVNKGVALGEKGDADTAVAVFDGVVAAFKDSDAPAIQEQVAMAMANKGVVLGEKGDSAAEIAAYDDVVAAFKGSDAPALKEPVAMAMLNKGITLGKKGDADAAIAVYDDVIAAFKGSDAPALQEQVAKAMVNKGVALGEKGDADAAIAVCDDVVAAFKGSDSPALKEQVAMAMVNKGVALGEKGDADAAIAVCNDVIAAFKGSDAPALKEHVARAMVNKGFALDKKGDADAAIAVCDEVIAAYKDSVEPTLQEGVARAMVNKGVALRRKGDSDAAIAIYDEVIEAYRGSAEPALQEQVARAMANKGVALRLKGGVDEKIANYDEMIAKFGESDEPAFRKLTAMALFYKGFTLREAVMGEEANAEFNCLLSQFKNEKDPLVLRYAAQALYEKGERHAAIGLIDDVQHTYKDALQDDAFWNDLKELKIVYRDNNHAEKKKIYDRDETLLKDEQSGKVQSLPGIIYGKISNWKKLDDKLDITFNQSGNIWEISFKNADDTDELFSLITMLHRWAPTVWRGSLGDYPLKASYFRNDTLEAPDDHRKRFLLSLRGIQGSADILQSEVDTAEQWALAQHYNCKTPMLDWSFSPYVALFFAFRRQVEDNAPKKERMLYALNPGAVTDYSLKDDEYKDKFRFRLPRRINNPRLFAQSGVLLQIEFNEHLEALLSKHKEKKDQFSLLKIFMPEDIRRRVLWNLNAMNINHRTLFPENIGAGEHANMALEIDGYDPILHVVRDSE